MDMTISARFSIQTCVTCNVLNYYQVGMMKSAIVARVQKHRANLRHKGLKLVQIWVPDVRSKGFAQECKDKRCW